MVRRSEAELISYVAAHSDQVALALRDTPDATAANLAMQRAAAAVRRIPHPVEPDCPLPNWCEAHLEDGAPVLRLDMQDQREYAGQVVATILASLGDIDGRLEPARPPAPPYDYDANADILGGADPLSALDARGLPPGFPAGFPVPEHAVLVLAQRGRDDGWEHAAWRRDRPFAEYPDRLRAFGCSLDIAPATDPVMGPTGMVRHRLRHPTGTGSVSVYHEYRSARRPQPGPPTRWYVSVVWRPAR
jgi:hypothetical protein